MILFLIHALTTFGASAMLLITEADVTPSGMAGNWHRRHYSLLRWAGRHYFVTNGSMFIPRINESVINRQLGYFNG